MSLRGERSLDGVVSSDEKLPSDAIWRFCREEDYTGDGYAAC